MSPFSTPSGLAEDHQIDQTGATDVFKSDFKHSISINTLSIK